jgi:transcriptional regulator with XRE-family HTH domain
MKLPDEQRKLFTERLRSLRGKLTQAELGERCSLKQGAISLYETGEDMPGVLTLLKLATGLKVTLETLVEGLDVKFDAVYRGLRVSITADENPPSDEDRQNAEGPEDAPEYRRLDQIVHGAPTEPPGSDHEQADVATTREDFAALHRTLSELVSIAGRLSARSDSMARPLGSRVRPDDRQTLPRARRKHQKGPTKKRLRKRDSPDKRS